MHYGLVESGIGGGGIGGELFAALPPLPPGIVILFEYRHGNWM